MINTTITAQNNPRRIQYIVVHCTATAQSATVENIMRYWRDHLGWKRPGYHYIVKPDGTIVSLLPEALPSNGVAGYNANSVHVCYIGGVDVEGNPADTRTVAQTTALRAALVQLKRKYPTAIVQGHRDFPGVKKACPSFDARSEYTDIK